MSDQEQHEAIGRLVQELGNNKRKLAAFESELDSFEKAFRAIAEGLGRNKRNDYNIRLVLLEIQNRLILNGMDFSKLTSFLEDYSLTRDAVERGTQRLQELGV